MYTPPTETPPFYGVVSVYDPNGPDVPNRSLGSGLNARLGYRTKGHCGRRYPELTSSLVCPWSVDVNVDYDSSIFDSRFLQSDYLSFLDQIGTVKGMAGTVKATFGPWLLVGEWNGAIQAASLIDDANMERRIRPAAWQVALGYQFDWNPWVDVIGEQGDFVSVTYSRSHDLAGVKEATGSRTSPSFSRVGFLPKERLIVTAGEWVLESTKLSVEYSRDSDYGKDQVASGRRAHQFVFDITYNF